MIQCIILTVRLGKERQTWLGEVTGDSVQNVEMHGPSYKRLSQRFCEEDNLQV